MTILFQSEFFSKIIKKTFKMAIFLLIIDCFVPRNDVIFNAIRHCKRNVME